MTDLDTKEPLSNISDSSFIILGQGSLPPSISSETSDAEYLDKSQNAFVVFEQSKPLSNRNTPSGTSGGQSYLEGDIQEKLQQLARENNQLKETLVQNNLALRSQVDTFYMWQQEVLKTHESHKEKFLETKDLILKLRAENLNLRNQLTEGFWTVCDDDDLSMGKGKKCNCDNLKEETGKLKSTCKDLTSKNEILEMENAKLREKLQAAEEEVLRLNSELQDVREKFLRQKSSTGSLNCEESPNTQGQMHNLNGFGEEKGESQSLEENFTKAKESDQLSALENVDEYLKNFDDLKTSFECQNKGLSTLQSWVAVAEENLDKSNKNLLGEMKELKCHISEEEKTREENLQELRNQFNRLLEDYKALQEQLSSIQDKDPDMKKWENEISSLYQQLDEKEQEFLQKQEECNELREEIKKLNLKCEEMDVLKIQLELYRSDFNEERTAREKLVGEKETMAEQIRLLESKLEALEKKPEEEKHEEVQKAQPFFRPYEVRKGTFQCPKCMFAFRDLKTCEEHVDECVNIHFYP